MKVRQVARQGFEVIARGALELIELNNSVEHVQFSERNVPNLWRDTSKTADSPAVIQGFCRRIAERRSSTVGPAVRSQLDINAFTGSMQGEGSGTAGGALGSVFPSGQDSPEARRTDFALPLGFLIHP